MEPELKEGKRWWLFRHPILFAFVVPVAAILCSSLVSRLAVRLIGSLVAVDPQTVRTVISCLSRIFCGVLVYVLMKSAYGNALHLGFTKRNLKPTLLLAIPIFLTGLSNIPEYLTNHYVWISGISGFLMAALRGFAPGFFEEITLRGGALNNLMLQWKDKSGRVLKSLLASAVAFGLVHFVNLLSGGHIWETLLQVCYATAFGILFGAVYLRTKNMIALVTAHSFVDFMAYLFVPTEASVEVTAYSIASSIVICVVFTTFGLYLVRGEKRQEIEETFFAV